MGSNFDKCCSKEGDHSTIIDKPSCSSSRSIKSIILEQNNDLPNNGITKPLNEKVLNDKVLQIPDCIFTILSKFVYVEELRILSQLTKGLNEKIVTHTNLTLNYALVLSFKDGSPEITLYNIKSKLQIRKLLPMSFPKGCDVVIIKENLYIMGGEGNGWEFLRNIWEYNFFTKKISELKEMIYEKKDLSTLPYKDTHIFSVGGYIQNRALPFCERYNINTNQWKLLPNLQQSKCKCAVCVFRPRYLFSFGGLDSEIRFVDDIERLNLHKLSKGWRNFTIHTGIHDWTGRSRLGVIQISPKNILIFGGYPRVKDTLLFTPYVKRIKMLNETQLKYEDDFYQRKPVLHEGKVYIYGSNTNGIHRYFRKIKKWEYGKEVSYQNIKFE